MHPQTTIIADSFILCACLIIFNDLLSAVLVTVQVLTINIWASLGVSAFLKLLFISKSLITLLS